jgi:hypothetical protein
MSPLRYPYDPPPRLAGGLGAAGALALILFSREGADRPWGAAIGGLVLAVSALLLFRRRALARELTLDDEAITVPSGFLRAQLKRVPYSKIKGFSQSRLMGLRVLFLETPDGRLEIHESMLGEYYGRVLDELARRVKPSSKP